MTPVATRDTASRINGSVTMRRRLRTPVPPVEALSKQTVVEPRFAMMLADPEIRLLVRADNVDDTQVLTMLKSVSVLHREEPKDRKGPRYRVKHPETRKYRRGVGIVLINERSEIFIARRNDVPGNAWQMPQGSIDRRETPRQAAYRELKEEIGTDNAEIIAESARWLYYDLPASLAMKVWGGRWKGQRQKWFTMRFKGQDREIDIAMSHPEFDAWRWVSMAELESLAVSFEKQLYVSLLQEFTTILRG
jgi:putative (di)nucleoside polyphosphate hydrolase